MNLFKFHKFYDPEGGEGGTPPEGGEPKKDAAASNADLAASIAAAIKAGVASAAPPPVPAPAPAAPALDPAKAAERMAAINTKYNDMMKEGKYAEAADFLLVEKGRLAQDFTPKEDVSKHPVIIAGIERAEKDAKREHAALFSKYEKEIKAEIDKLDPMQRQLPSSWDNAANSVRARHFDELMAEAVTGKLAEAKKAAEPPQATPRGSRSTTSGVASLDAEEQIVSKAMGVDPQVYATNKANIEAEHTARDGAIVGVPLVDPGVPKPGRF